MEIQPEQPFSRVTDSGGSCTSTGRDSDSGPVYVAVGGDKKVKESKSTLIWALRNMRPSKIVLAHVHYPSRTIPMPLGGRFEASLLCEEELRAFRLEEKMKMNATLDTYLVICKAYKVQAETLIEKADDTSTGLLKLISDKGITRLVMGASTFSRTKKTPKSKTASAIFQKAVPACNIWFVSKGDLISTRDSILLRNGISAESLTTNIIASPRIMSMQSKPSPSRSPQAGMDSVPFYQFCRQKSGFPLSDSPGRETDISTSRRSPDPWSEVPKSPWFSYTSSKSGRDDSTSNSGSSLTLKGEDIGNGAGMSPLVHESLDDPLSPLGHHYQESLIADLDLFDKLQTAMMEAEICKEEAHKEYLKRCSAEKELLLANQRAGLLERSLARESNIRVEIEAKYNREKAESENLRKELDEVFRELQVSRQHKLELDTNIKDLELRFSHAENILISLQKERDLLHEEKNQLQQVLDDAVCQVERLQNRIMEKGRSNLRIYMSEFSHLELVEATDNFKSASRIGEGRYGIVYKGFLRQTAVAIKKVHPQSMKGHLEFHIEMTILSRVRHPNLVTLIGACEEENALIYEFLPCGSLEDCLQWKGNDPSLSWQARIRICTEICSALIFLHSARPRSVVHGDLKPANILLDANLVSKLSDFGLSYLLTQSPASSTFSHQTDPEDTFCYMDPLFLSSGELTPSSDVYSFGIIVLQLLTAKRPCNIARDVQMALENNRLHEILDKSAGDWPFVQAQQLAHLGIRCCAIDRKSRPDLVKEVWRILEPMKKAAIGSSLYLRKMDEDENHNIPSYFICPVFQEIMSDPHVAADGYTYEVEAIKGWLQSGHATSPMTNLKLENEKLTPNHALRSAIQEWSQQRCHT